MREEFLNILWVHAVTEFVVTTLANMKAIVKVENMFFSCFCLLFLFCLVSIFQLPLFFKCTRGYTPLIFFFLYQVESLPVSPFVIELFLLLLLSLKSYLYSLDTVFCQYIIGKKFSQSMVFPFIL